MNDAWKVLWITAGTDAIISGQSGLLAVTALGAPSKWAIIAIITGMLAAAARTIQQALKANAATSAELKGDIVKSVTTTAAGTVVTTAPAALPVNVPQTGGDHAAPIAP